MALTEPIRNPKHVRALLNYYRSNGQKRNHLLIAIALHTALRISDILNIRCEDVYDFAKRRVRSQITVTEQKTGKVKIIALHKTVKKALKAYFPEACQGKPLILNARTGKAISRVHAHRVISDAAHAVGIPYKVGCHSLRKTFGYFSWKSGASSVVLMQIYNHSSYNITRKYLGISQDDQNAVYESLNFGQTVSEK